MNIVICCFRSMSVKRDHFSKNPQNSAYVDAYSSGLTFYEFAQITSLGVQCLLQKWWEQAFSVDTKNRSCFKKLDLKLDILKL